MSLKDALNDFKYAAEMLGDYTKFSIDELANSYCQAIDDKDEESKDIYISALMVRFWYVIPKMYQKVKATGVEIEDLVIQLYECITTACEYRAWQKDEKLNAQQCINAAISSRGAARILYFSNLDKHRANINAVRLDAPIDSSVEDSDTLLDTLSDTSINIDGSAEGFIQSLVSDNKLVEAIIFDNIINKDVFKHEKTTIKEYDEDGKVVNRMVEGTTEFWPFRLVQELNSLSKDYIKYFLDTYTVKKEQIEVAFTFLENANNSKKYKIISKTLENVRKQMNY